MTRGCVATRHRSRSMLRLRDEGPTCCSVATMHLDPARKRAGHRPSPGAITLSVDGGQIGGPMSAAARCSPAARRLNDALGDERIPRSRIAALGAT